MTRKKSQPDINELLDRAFQAISEGDRESATVLAGQVLAVDRNNADAEDLLAAPVEHGEIRRLTIMFADVVDSTVLSTRVEPEVYRAVVGRYRDQVQKTVEKYEGHIASTKGDGLLAVFGHPIAHENDVHRAVHAGLEITRDIAQLNERARRQFGVGIAVRVGIHRGVVYLDIAEDDVYGFAANLTARLSGFADPNTVMVSDAIEQITKGSFELEKRRPRPAKGVEGVVGHYRVIAERDNTQFPLGPLVGREGESAHLEAAWALAQRGTLDSPGIALRGEAGIGKSRLAGSAAERARQSNGVVLELIGSPFHTDVGLRPVRRLLERRCGIDRTSYPAERLRHLEAELYAQSLDSGRLLPLLAPVLGVAPESGYAAVHAQGLKLFGQIVEAVHEYIMACVDGGPVLVVAEDVHWFDDDTIDVLRLLLRERTGSMMIVMTGRDEAALPTGPETTLFDLKPLTEDETDELVLALHPGMTADARRAVRRRCDGVPLYIEEVVVKLKEQPSDVAGRELVPDTLYEALFARLRSSDNSVRVAEAAATIGSTVDRKLLLSVVDLSEQAVDAVLLELTNARVLKSVGEDRWRFRHELLREVAAELSPPSLRRKLHSRVADAMVAGAADENPDWPLVARHYVRAERYLEAAMSYQQAAADARRRGALGEARNYLSHAINQIERSEPGLERDRGEIALRHRRGFLAMAAEGVSSATAAADFERCMQLSGTHLTDSLFATLIALYGYYAIRADLQRAAHVLESVRVGVEDGREWFRPFNDAGFGMLDWYRGDFAAAEEKLSGAAAARSEEGARELGTMWFMPNEGTASIYTHLALAHFSRGDWSGAQNELNRTAERCDDTEFPQGAFSLAYAHQMECLMWVEAGDYDRAAHVAGALTAIGDQHGFDSWTFAGTAQGIFVAALVELATGKSDSATLASHVEALTGVIDMWRALGVVSLITFYDGILARVLIASGQLEQARERVDIALALAQQTGMRFHDAELLRIRANTHVDSEDRQADLTRAIELARQQGATIYELRCAAEDYEARGEPARQALIEAIDRFPADSGWPPLALARALLE